MRERFAPGVVIDGRRVEPPGWVWVLAFARAGCPWAVEKVLEDPEFYKERMRESTVTCRADPD